ncbi:Beta-1,3-N-acetylglucosaminyltransferase lunatic fringe like [Actinidia chinensis var. chinensis]|uniref:Beta-1,3-N-acetylglucosaminyltransferase lunatic fringe like n=1 Tax=Actinidia chinensis var. chinensis TaxID=1590841 RepID=A0A2R6QCD5_ACTCC|nr:Beta-1,3-N-acetylglucosaminyltransferase lunatic fringe like [Actinidia chinensis var. chinensis]
MQLPHQLSPKPRNSFSLLVNLIRIFSFLCIIYLFLTLFLLHSSKFVSFSSSENVFPPTTIEHVVFGIASNQDSWSKGKDYVKLWWRPDKMRGCVFHEKMPPNTPFQNDSDSLPPMCISEDTARFRYTYRGGPRSSVRIARVVSETVSLNHSNVRWFVFGDDDTVFFPENLVKTLSKYDHELWHYIGTNSEVLTQNKLFSFDMAFGGAGFAISYPLARVLASVFDSCLERYPHIYGSDGRVHACIAELGIGMAHEPGFHQMDIRGNVFGLLAAHPNTPVVSLHNLDQTDPIFPNMTTTEALEHLLHAAKVDPHRLLQQTVCYDRWFSWTFSVSWGYAVQVFGNHVFLPDVLRAQQTFEPWRRGNPLAEAFNFDTRDHHPDPCRRPTVFFFDRADFGRDGRIKSSYRRLIIENCTFDNFSPKKLEEIRVLSNKLELGIKQLQAPRRHCCDVLPSSAGKVMDIGIRECREDELINMHP